MSEETENTTTIEDKVVEVIGQLQDLAGQVAQPVMDATLAAVQIDGMASLAFGAAGIPIAVYSAHSLFKNAAAAQDSPYNEEGRYIVKCAVFAVMLLISGISALCNLFSTYNWIAAFNPLAGLAYRIIN